MISCIRYYYQSGLNYKFLAAQAGYERLLTRGRSVPTGAYANG